MQTISGIHYNFSVPDTLWPAVAAARGESLEDETPTRAYFDLIRNFRRRSWLLLYLFGASPAVCKSFVRGGAHGLESFDEGSLYLPDATTLRMGPLGYQSSAQASLHVSYNSLADYGTSIHEALARPWPPYAAIGLRDGRGEYRQLGTGLLQIENEFYGTIRPKRRTRSGERPIAALRDRGVEYVEVRCLDLNPFLRVGIDAHAMRFMDVFLLHCLLAESPPDSPEESERMQANQSAIVERGRAPGLSLLDGGRRRDRTEWAAEILDGCAEVAGAIDDVTGNDLARYAVELQRRKVADPERTPSARILATMRLRRMPFFPFRHESVGGAPGVFRRTPHALRPGRGVRGVDRKVGRRPGTRGGERHRDLRRLRRAPAARHGRRRRSGVNFLAHCLLGHPHEALMAGGFIGDFVKGPVPETLPPELQAGVRLHRRVDAVSNRLPGIRTSVGRLDPELRRVGPVLLDILGDHCLATRWDRHGHGDLAAILRIGLRRHRRVRFVPARLRQALLPPHAGGRPLRSLPRTRDRANGPWSTCSNACATRTWPRSWTGSWASSYRP